MGGGGSSVPSVSSRFLRVVSSTFIILEKIIRGSSLETKVKSKVSVSKSVESKKNPSFVCTQWTRRSHRSIVITLKGLLVKKTSGQIIFLVS